MKKIQFKLNEETKLSNEVINSIPISGPADSAVQDLREEYDIKVNNFELVSFLKKFGCWDNNELNDHNENIDRLLWIACLDCRENETTHFYFG